MWSVLRGTLVRTGRPRLAAVLTMTFRWRNLYGWLVQSCSVFTGSHAERQVHRRRSVSCSSGFRSQHKVNQSPALLHYVFLTVGGRQVWFILKSKCIRVFLWTRKDRGSTVSDPHWFPPCCSGHAVPQKLRYLQGPTATFPNTECSTPEWNISVNYSSTISKLQKA